MRRLVLEGTPGRGGGGVSFVMWTDCCLSAPLQTEADDVIIKFVPVTIDLLKTMILIILSAHSSHTPSKHPLYTFISSSPPTPTTSQDQGVQHGHPRAALGARPLA